MNAVITRPLNTSILRWWQATWVLLAVLAFSRFAFGAAVYYQGINKVCHMSLQECHTVNRLSSEDVTSLAADGISPEEFAAINIAVFFILNIFFTVVSVLIFVQRRESIPVGLMALALMIFGSGFGFNGILNQEYPRFRAILFILQNISWALLPMFFYTFPNGRIVPRYIWLFLPVWIFYWMLDIIFPGINKESSGYLLFSNFVWLFMWIGMAAAQIYRYKKISNVEERRQSKWVVAGVILAVLLVVIFAGFLPDYDLFGNKTPYTAMQLFLSSLFTLTVISTFPVSIGIAILRSRLWDIDFIIRKTLVYALLSGMLGLIYFGGVALLQNFLTADGVGYNGGGQAANGQPLDSPPSGIIIVLTTLAVAAIFNPLRRRLQDFIDRRFYRQKYDSEKALAGFAATARSEASLPALTGSLVNVIQDTMQPEEINLWLTQEQRRSPSK